MMDRNDRRRAGERLDLNDSDPMAANREIAASDRMVLLRRPAPRSPDGPEEDWTRRLRRHPQQGHVIKSYANAMLVLQNDGRWRGVFGYDVREERVLLLRRPPYDMTGTEASYPRPFADRDVPHVIAWLGETYGLDPRVADVNGMIDAISADTPIDRVREYLDALQWDGVERLSRWPVTRLGVQSSAYAETVARKWMISAVARTVEPGCKCDHMLILEGPQGAGKSSALAALAGPDYFGDDVPALGTKDAQQYLGGRWIVELGEMDAASKAETATLKRFLTTTADRYRPPFGRRMIEHRRRCVFAGTVNENEYLRDTTGGRRFWPLRCAQTGPIQLEALRRDRDQLWAEAKHAYRSGETWHIEDESLIAEAQREQAQRLESDPWVEPIEKWLAARGESVTTGEILTGALDLLAHQTTRREGRRVGAIMRALGWDYREGRCTGGLRGTKAWHRPVRAEGSP